jgi:hypothetical protein
VPGLIAFRNLLLGIGGLLSIYFIYKNIDIINKINKLPIKLLGLLLLWVVIHFIFFSYDRNLQLKELTGLWFRTVLAMLMAFVLAIYLNNNNQRSFLVFGLCIGSTVLINISFYFYQSFFEQRFIFPGEQMGRPFYKIETVFWGSIWIAYALAFLNIIISQKKSSKKYLFLCLAAVLLSFFSAFLSTAKNGFLIALILIFSFITVSLINSSFRKNKLLVFINLIFIVFILIFSYLHLKTANGWTTLVNDVSIGIQFEKFDNWKNPSNGSPPNVISPSTYDRIAWGIAGYRLILDHPLGYGLVNQSFESWLKHLQIEHKTSRQTHSGWIDFGLAFGIPGVALLWAVIIYIFYIFLMKKTILSVFSIWISSTIFILAFISEIFYKQFFEAVMFWLTFSAVAISLPLNLERKCKNLE